MWKDMKSSFNIPGWFPIGAYTYLKKKTNEIYLIFISEIVNN